MATAATATKAALSAYLDSTDKLANTDRNSHIAAIRGERHVFTRDAKAGLPRHASESAFLQHPRHYRPATTAVRAHWTIETTSHYSRDLIVGEGRSRIQSNATVFARLRSFPFNILKANPAGTLSRGRHRAALAGIDSLLELISISQD